MNGVCYAERDSRSLSVTYSEKKEGQPEWKSDWPKSPEATGGTT